MELTICQSEIFLICLYKSCEYINMKIMHFHRIVNILGPVEIVFQQKNEKEHVK
jgi:hypothetical protein